MKRWVIITVLSALCLLGGAGIILFQRNCSFTTSTRTYATVEDAIKEGVIEKGWLPDFLPRSARNIREKHNYEQNTVIAAFSFPPSENITTMLEQAKELPPDRLKGIRASVMCGKEGWFPDAIIQGKWETLAQKGFRFYAISDPHSASLGNWYLAVHREAGIGYLWN